MASNFFMSQLGWHGAELSTRKRTAARALIATARRECNHEFLKSRLSSESE